MDADREDDGDKDGVSPLIIPGIFTFCLCSTGYVPSTLFPQQLDHAAPTIFVQASTFPLQSKTLLPGWLGLSRSTLFHVRRPGPTPAIRATITNADISNTNSPDHV